MVALSLILALRLQGQPNATNARPVAPVPAPAVRVNPPPAPGGLDPLMVVQQSGIDMNATVSAEFDPPAIGLGGRATYRIVVTAMSESVTVSEKLPVPKGLEFVQTARSQTFTPLGTTVQPRTTYNYRVNATAVGTYTMPPFSLSANGKQLVVPSCQLTVVASNAVTALREPRLQIEPAQGDYYVGQTIPVRVVLVDPGDNSVQAMLSAQLTGDACLVDQSLVHQRREARVVDGKQVAAFITEMLVAPIKEGPLTLTAQAHAFLTHQPANPTIRLPQYNPLLDADPVIWKIQHVPKEGELPGYTGGIGTFQLEPPLLSTNVLRAGDPLAMMVTVKGMGNLTHLVAPKPPPQKDWQVFPALADQSPSPVIQQRGSVQFIYTLIPLNDRVTATPSIPFSYFDPNKRAYVDLTVPPTKLKVTPPPANLALPAQPVQPVAAGPNDEDSLNGERGLAMTGLAEHPEHRVWSLRPLQQRPWFLVLQLVPALVLGGLWGWHKRSSHLAKHPEILLQRRARRGLRRELRIARKAAVARDPNVLVTAAMNALREACAPPEAANPQALVCADVVRGLRPAERSGREAELVRALFSAGDALRFATASPAADHVLGLWPETENLLERIKRRL